VSQGTNAPPSRSTPLWRRIQQTAAANPLATAVALYAITAIGAFVAAYFGIFSEFAPYDDEGTLLITLKAFVHGDALYRDIWSVYGPFYYELFGAFFKVTGLQITTDASRIIVLFIWVGTATLFGVAAQRLTGRLSLGLTAMIAAFADLTVLANEPMHPQGLVVLLLSVFALCAVSGLGRRIGWSGALCGIVLAALLLTKVNLGVFAIAGTVLAIAVSVEPIHRRGWLRWILIVAFLAMPTVVLVHELRANWVRELLIIEFLAAVAVLVASRPLRPRPGEGDGGTFDWVLAALAGFIGAFVVIIAIVLVTGPSISDVYEGVVSDALEIRNVLSSQFPFPAGAAIDWAIVTLAVATVASGLRLARGSGAAPWWSGLLRAAAGLTIICSVAHVIPIALNPSSGSPILVPMLLVWVVAMPPAGVVETPYKRFLRVLLPLVAIAETLQVYPVPGSQVGIAAAFFVMVGALVLGDALTELKAWSGTRDASTLQTYTATVGVVLIALPAAFGLNTIVLPAASGIVQHHELPKLDLPGAKLMHLGAPQNEEYSDLVGFLHENNCSTFVGWPSVNSLYLWAELEAPRPTIPNGWFYAMTESQQQLAVEELKASRRPCAIVNEELAGSYLKGLPPPDTPLVHYVKNNFRPVTEIGSFTFELPKPSATGG
jgi:hypothetical protein